MRLSIFARAASYANLSPMERAVLKFLSIVLWGALVAGAQAVAPLFTSMDPTTIPWASVLHTFLAAFTLAMLLSVRKYTGAQGDPPLPSSPPLPVAAPTPAPTPAPTLSAAAPSAPPASSLVSASAAAVAPADAAPAPSAG